MTDRSINEYIYNPKDLPEDELPVLKFGTNVAVDGPLCIAIVDEEMNCTLASSILFTPLVSLVHKYLTSRLGKEAVESWEELYPNGFRMVQGTSGEIHAVVGPTVRREYEAWLKNQEQS